jgi:RNA 2',3'-cyclic 3'-phosphodiesterase
VGDVGRGFVAVVPPPGVLDAVAARSEGLELPDPARRTTRPQWHLTLRFLGTRVDYDAVADGLRALAATPGRVQLGGVGAFPKERRAHTLWLGVVEGADLLAGLAAAVGMLVAPLGHVPEAGPYHPHLTLARLRAPVDVRPVVARFDPGPVGDPWTVDSVILFRSHTRSTGAIYEEHTRIALAS